MPYTRRMFLTAAGVLVAAAAAFNSVACSSPEPPPPPGPQRIVAIGDVHGSYSGFTTILQAAGLIDADHHWAAGTTTFVQTGDLPDRGDGVRAALDLLMRLQVEAAAAGGRVEPLLGNHEIVTFVEDLRDVSPVAYASFADVQSEQRRESAYEAIVAAAQRRGQAGSVPDKAAWMTAHPLGFIEYNQAMGPEGHYGRWLRQHKVLVEIEGTVFMHAGIDSTFQGTLEDVNRTVADEIARWDRAKAAMVAAGLIPPFATIEETTAAATAELARIDAATKAQTPLEAYADTQFIDGLKFVTAIQQSALLNMEGPMWFRGFALWKDEDEPAFTAMRQRLGVKRFVAGHTPMPPTPLREIRNRWDFSIFQIDTGMLGGTFFPEGRPSALEIVGDRITVIYTDSRQVVVPGGGQAAGGGN